VKRDEKLWKNLETQKSAEKKIWKKYSGLDETPHQTPLINGVLCCDHPHLQCAGAAARDDRALLFALANGGQQVLGDLRERGWSGGDKENVALMTKGVEQHCFTFIFRTTNTSTLSMKLSRHDLSD
jgi:hypothetical protein